MIIHRVTVNDGEIHLLVSKLKLLSEEMRLRDEEACHILRMPPGAWPLTPARASHWTPEAWIERRLRHLVDILTLADRLLGEEAAEWLRRPTVVLGGRSPVDVMKADHEALAAIRAVLIEEDRG